MPSPEWNRHWARHFRNFRSRTSDQLYGLQWGDPDLRGLRYLLTRLLRRRTMPGPLYRIVDRHIKPHVKPDSTVLEIGSGGGRWTRYLVGGRKLLIADINDVFFGELRKMFPSANLEFYRPQGCELHGISDQTVDFAFSFGTFVHIDPDGIQSYLDEIQRVLKPAGVVVIQYADKEKRRARRNPVFSDMTAAKMEAMAPMRIIAHDTRLLNHSNIVVMQKQGR